MPAFAATSPRARKLRVGLFAATRMQPRWVADAFTKVAESGFAEVVAIGWEHSGAPARAGARRPLLWQLYDRLDRIAFKSGPNLTRPVDLVKVPHVSELSSFREKDLVALKLDVAFALGDFDDRTLDGIAHYGVWRFCFGDQNESQESLAGLNEVARDAPLTRSGLKVRLSAGSPARLAYQSWSRTYPFSVSRNRAQMLRKTAQFAHRALEELHSSGQGWLEQCKPAENRGQSPISPESRGHENRGQENRGQAPISEGQGENRALTPILSIGGRILQRGIEKALNVEQWFLAYRLRESRFGDGRHVPADLNGFTRLMPPKDRYWADPFVMEKNGRYYVFFEELMFKTGKAHISVLEIDAAGRASEPVRVLECDYHLSYPFLVEDGGSLYMIPESAQAGTVEAWRCVEFPYRWRLERVLVAGVRCVDATFHRGSDRWWMFANFAADKSSVFDDELHLFHSDRLLGEWQPHRKNPIKSDVRGARPAGQLYWRNGVLYRPAQICAPLYGSGMSINRVLRLTPHDYAERQVERILPSARHGIFGIHTQNRAGNLTIVDAFTRRPRL